MPADGCDASLAGGSDAGHFGATAYLEIRHSVSDLAASVSKKGCKACSSRLQILETMAAEPWRAATRNEPVLFRRTFP